jgi:hypothetical protein
MEVLMASTIGFGVFIGLIIGYILATIQYRRKVLSLQSMWNDFVSSLKSELN